MVTRVGCGLPFPSWKITREKHLTRREYDRPGYLFLQHQYELTLPRQDLYSKQPITPLTPSAMPSPLYGFVAVSILTLPKIRSFTTLLKSPAISSLAILLLSLTTLSNCPSVFAPFPVPEPVGSKEDRFPFPEPARRVTSVLWIFCERSSICFVE